MRQRLTILLTFAVIIGVLILVSTFSYVQKGKEMDYEFAPNRSTYHSGPTGVRALYDFLNESGYKVTRWKETPQKLLTDYGSFHGCRNAGTLAMAQGRRSPGDY
jgi:hypothetical protein